MSFFIKAVTVVLFASAMVSPATAKAADSAPTFLTIAVVSGSAGSLATS